MVWDTYWNLDGVFKTCVTCTSDCKNKPIRGGGGTCWIYGSILCVSGMSQPEQYVDY